LSQPSSATAIAEYLYVEPRGNELPFYVRVYQGAEFEVCDRRGKALNEWLTEKELRKAGKLSRAIPCETMSGVVLVPV
jgi:hypothetical protein